MKEIDIDLLRACQRGDTRAFERLFQIYREPIFRLAYRFTGNRDDAEDLTQEIFVKVFERIGSFRCESSFATWLYRLAVNTCLNFRRDAKHVESLSVIDYWEDEIDPEATCEQLELQRRIDAEIAALPQSLKVPFVLIVLEEMSYRNVAEVLDLSIEAVRMRVSRARQILREKLLRYLEG